jgi:hypothetical protein
MSGEYALKQNDGNIKFPIQFPSDWCAVPIARGFAVWFCFIRKSAVINGLHIVGYSDKKDKPCYIGI